MTLTVEGAVAGVAFGHPDGACGATLEGIAVDDAFTAHGLGSLPLACSEQAAGSGGYRNVILGSADGCVENGYRQTEYMVLIPDGDRRFLDLGGLDVPRERHRKANALVLKIAEPEGYSPARRTELRERLNVSEVCCIFANSVTP